MRHIDVNYRQLQRKGKNVSLSLENKALKTPKCSNTKAIKKQLFSSVYSVA
jgi:hypothetical protein